jgi:hypothetical protein
MNENVYYKYLDDDENENQNDQQRLKKIEMTTSKTVTFTIEQFVDMGDNKYPRR